MGKSFPHGDLQIPKTKITVCSGYFATGPHLGHIRMFQEAKLYTDQLWVIVNNDEQLFNKKGFIVLSERERMELVSAVKYVDRVILAIDNDSGVSKTLQLISQEADIIIFANGGDRNPANYNAKEVDFCLQNGIILKSGVGGTNKIQSSTNIIETIRKHYQNNAN